MGVYAVYTRIKKGDGTDREIMITNIKSTSCGGAEHKVLDVHYSITNALAFDMENPVDFINYIVHCQVYDFEDFKRRYMLTVNKRQEAINEVFNEIDEIIQENKEHSIQIYEHEKQIKYLQEQIDDNNKYIEERTEELKEFCEKVNMRMNRVEDNEYVIGIA